MIYGLTDNPFPDLLPSEGNRDSDEVSSARASLEKKTCQLAIVEL